MLHKKNFSARVVMGAMLWTLAMALLPAARPAWSVPLEVYGRLPSTEDVALSPDGTRIAMISTSGDKRFIVVISLTERKALGKFEVGAVKLHSLQWADDDRLIIITSDTSLPFGLIGSKSEWYLLHVLDVVKQKLSAYPDPDKVTDFRIMNVLAGRAMIRRLDGHTVLFMDGLYAGDEVLLPALFRIDLNTGGQRIVRQGSALTQDWLVDEAGEVVAEEDYDRKQQRWSVLERRGGRLQEIASGHEPIDIPELLGFGPDGDTLLMEMTENGDPVWRQLSLRDGSFGRAMAERAALEEPIEDRLTHHMIGGVHLDDAAHYVFFDPKVQARWNGIVAGFTGQQVEFISASADFKKIVVRVTGPVHGYCYQLVDMATHRAEPVGDIYQGIEKPLEVKRITYTAADGLEIPAYLTFPGDTAARNLPLIMFPHGGPASRDTAEFDWWAQAMAAQGYLVMQPNFRGSTLTMEHLSKGFGEWGRKMQTDLSDGVRYLVKQGMVDPARVCIVGASYGGYAALAGVTLDPGVYRCAVSVAGVSDLKRMLQAEVHDDREKRYWNRFMGVTGPSDPILQQISPIKHVDAVTVPVMLIHGRDDTVVLFDQSALMFDALKHAHKDVEMVALKNEDHHLSRSETRLQMLQVSIAFLRAHNPPDTIPASVN